MIDVRSTAEVVFRQESGRIIASLIRISGSFDRAEEAMQESFASALSSWPDKGIPENPGAWIMTTAHRKLIDAVRKERSWREKQDWLKYETETVVLPTDPEPDAPAMHFPDDRLRLIFTCCHPAINPEARVALTLRTLGGLSTSEIAKAFLLSEATLAQRLVQNERLPRRRYRTRFHCRSGCPSVWRQYRLSSTLYSMKATRQLRGRNWFATIFVLKRSVLGAC
jgi:RNA polymerase sigma-70 factor (ECF subfamily)